MPEERREGETKVKKKVVRLRWSSKDGRVEFRPLYGDGSYGSIQVTRLSTSQPEKFRLVAKKARDLIKRGREEEFMAFLSEL